ncbi:MAG: hypothetical protein OEW87_13265 [Flavobacteriaceae bacterium]|nr:hypothetical protein [Flavobacteriaceae bacterium]
MDIIELIEEYNTTYGDKLNKKVEFLSLLNKDELLTSLINKGMVVIDNESLPFDHLVQNEWYDKFQKDNEGNWVSFNVEFVKELKQSELLNKSSQNNFEGIFSKVNEIIKKLNAREIKGAGQMTKYDLALYIGAYLEVHPDKVYIHRGVIKGARLLELISNNDETIMDVADILNVRPELEQLGEALYIEDFLCVLKHLKKK